MSKGKYRSIYSSQMEAIVLIIFQIFFTKCAKLKIREYYSDIPQFLLGIQSRDAFRPINTQWIIINNYSPKWRWLVVDGYLPSREASR